MIGYVEQPDYVGLESVQENYDPSFGFLLQKSARLGFRDTSLSLLASMQRMADAEKEGKIDRKQWEDSEFYDERIQYDHSFTYAKARLLKQRFDMEDEYAYYLRQAQGTDYIAGVSGLILGSIPDPINFIPMLGALSKPMRVLRYAGLSQRMARGALGAADAAIASTLVSPLLMSERATYQQKYDAQDALIDIGLATGIGFAFGSVLGRVRPDDSYPPSRIPTPEEVAEGLEGSLKDDVAKMIGADEPALMTEVPVKKAPRRKKKVQDAIETVPPENRAAAVAKAINQIGRGEPVNVAAEMQPVVSVQDVKQQRFQYLENKYKTNEEAMTPAEFNELSNLEEELRDVSMDLDYTIAGKEEMPTLVEQEFAQIEKVSLEELDYELNQAIEQGRFTDEEVMRFMADDDLTSEQSQKELTEFFGNLGYCVLNNG